MTPAEVADWVERSRAAQGLSPTIEDPAVIARVVTLALVGSEGGGGRAPSP